MEKVFFLRIIYSRIKKCLSQAVKIQKMTVEKPIAITLVCIGLAGIFTQPSYAAESAGASNLAIFISGLPGGEKYKNSIQVAFQLLQNVLLENGFDRKQMVRFSPEPSGAKEWGEDHFSRKAALEETMAEFAKYDGIYDTVFVFIAGHANGRDEDAKFHIPGEDISYQIMMKWIDAIPARKMILVLAISQGHIWIELLAKPGRIVIAGNGLREFDFMPVVFLRLFPYAFLNVANAQRKDSAQKTVEVSLRDAFIETQKGVANWYFFNQLRPTESALVDADGDGKGDKIVSWQIKKDRTSDGREIPSAKESADSQDIIEFAADVDATDAIAANAVVLKISGR
jgi:hypothetical protein